MRLLPDKDKPIDNTKYLIYLIDGRIIEGTWNSNENYFEVNCPYIYMEDVKWFIKSEDFINSVSIPLNKLEDWEDRLDDFEMTVNYTTSVRKEIESLIKPFYENK